MPCPVPNEQQPLNEYLSLKDSFFFRWATFSLFDYSKVAIAIWLAWWIVMGPIAAVSFSPSRHLPEFLCLGSAGATVGLGLPFLQLFVGWRYIRDRLQSPTVAYEESGWYDGQVWQKPEPDLLKERLLVSYEVQPVMRKIQLTAAVLIGLLILQVSLLQVLT
jgi:hypothetical protein